jgi:uncharacterized protein
MFALAAVNSRRGRPRAGLSAGGSSAHPRAAGGTEKRVKRSAGATRAGRFDAFDLAARGESLAGQIDATQRTRLADRLAPAPAAGPIVWSIVGGHDPSGRPTLAVSIEGSLPLVCQRCLQPFELRLAQRTELLLARMEAELEPLDAGDAEVVLAAEPLDALTLVEDEILLSLPFAPSHADGQCPAGPGIVAAPGAGSNKPSTTSPFARLSALKKGTDRSFEE